MLGPPTLFPQRFGLLNNTTALTASFLVAPAKSDFCPSRPVKAVALCSKSLAIPVKRVHFFLFFTLNTHLCKRLGHEREVGGGMSCQSNECVKVTGASNC